MSEINAGQAEHIDSMYRRLKGTSNLDLALVIGLKSSIEKLEKNIEEYKSQLAGARAAAFKEALYSAPGCSREGLCREKWTGPAEYDDCSACSHRQWLEARAAESQEKRP